MNKILVLTNNPQKQSVPRINTNKPEIRHENILKLLQQIQHFEILFTELKLNTDKLKELNVHHPDMIDYFINCYKSFLESPDPAFNYKDDGIIPYSFQTTRVATETIKNLTYWKQSGIWCQDVMTPIFEHTWQTMLESANNCFIAAQCIEFNKRQTIYCLNLYPGHHAKYDTYGGYCFLNNAAICARSLQNTYPHLRIGIIDLDHHAGNGTEQIFKDDQNVTTVSIHANPLFDYPYYDGYPTTNTSTNLNLTFDNGCDVKEYINLLAQAMQFICPFDVLIIPFGADTYKNDPDASSLCKCGLDIGDYEIIGKFIRKFSEDKPIIVTQEGGYDVDNVDKIVISLLSGLR